MCGIAGILDFDASRDYSQELRKMTHALKHRGPDGEGFFHHELIWLGHTRLSIIDLKGGHQPMKNEDGTLWLVFNGEIYNYLELITELKSYGHNFSTKSDTEVILHAYEEWGENCVNRFNGMWAFAIYDTRDGSLFASRDRFGIKPFYYFRDKNVFLFASEIKAILATGLQPEVNKKALGAFILDGYIDSNENTLFQKIQQTEPGHNLRLKDGRIRIMEYWPGSDVFDSGQNSDVSAEELYELVNSSVRLRLRSDVPIGSSLSGGLDSSTIVGIAHNLAQADKSAFNYHTFTASFPAFERDETQFVELLCQRFNCQANYVTVPGEVVNKQLEELTRIQEIPICTGSYFAQFNVMRCAHEQGIKVLLDGQGGDEIFAGYPMYFPAAAVDCMKTGSLKNMVTTLNAMHNHHPFSSVQVLSYFLHAFLPDSIKSFTRQTLKRGDIPLHANLQVEYVSKRFSNPLGFVSHLSRLQWLVLRHWQLPALLHYEDRSSMAFSIETRLPFLDYRLVEMGLKLPPVAKINDSQGKWILRKAVSSLVPHEITNRQDKIGFETPELQWFRGKLGNSIRKLALSDSLRQREWINPDWLTSLRKKIESVHHRLLWKLAGIELWARVFLDREI